MDEFAAAGKAEFVTRDLKSQVGERVRSLRMAAGRSQEAFAALANIDRSSFGKLERGELNVNLVTLARIAVALETTLSGLLDGVTLDAKQIQATPRAKRGPKPLGGRSEIR